MESWTDGATWNVLLVAGSMTILIRLDSWTEMKQRNSFFLSLQKVEKCRHRQWIRTWSKTDHRCNMKKSGMCQTSSTEYRSTPQSRKTQQSTHSHLHVACSAESQNARSLPSPTKSFLSLSTQDLNQTRHNHPSTQPPAVDPSRLQL